MIKFNRICLLLLSICMLQCLFILNVFAETGENQSFNLDLERTKYSYTGNAICPDIKVTDGFGERVSNNMYEISFINNTEVGMASVIVKFNDIDYTLKKNFVIVPKSPDNIKTELYGYDDVKVSWSEAKGASGYFVYYKKATSEKYSYLGKTVNKTIKSADLADGVKYTFKVIPYYKHGETRYQSLSYKTSSIYTLKQMSKPTVKKSSDSKVLVSWKDIYGQTGYQISKSTSSTGTNVVYTYTTESGTSKVIGGGTKGRPYYYKVRAYKKVGDVTVYGPWSASVKYTMHLSAPASVKAELYGYDDVKINWSKVSGATGYFVYYKKSTSESYSYMGRTTGNTLKKADLTDGVKYNFKVVPYYKAGDTRYLSANYRIASATTLKKVTIKGLTTKGSMVRVKWYNINGETGYQISRSLYKTGTNIIDTHETTSGKSKRVNGERKKLYYYKVRAYKTVNGKRIYGPWSDVKKYKRTSSSTKGYEEVLDYDMGNSLVLVNKEYSVSESYYPINMVTVKKSIATYSGIKLKELAYDAYLDMLEDARDAGHDFYICSGYRDFESQETLYNNSLRQNGKKYTEKMFAYPGTSEHHTGYAIDVTSKSMGWGLKQNFTDYADGAWITKHCSEYGFIIRYPKGKTDITGYTYEPWHLRYVGKSIAKEITKKGITLEEYLGVT